MLYQPLFPILTAFFISAITSHLVTACNKYSFAEVNNDSNTFKAVILHFEDGSLRMQDIKL